jgi:hypothetical protein
VPLPSTGSADLTPGSATEVHPLRAADVAAVTAAMPGLPYAPTNKHEERLGLQNAGSATYLIAWQGGEPVGHVLVRSSPVSEQGVAARCAEHERCGYADSGLGEFVLGYTYWDELGRHHRDEELHRYVTKPLS